MLILICVLFLIRYKKCVSINLLFLYLIENTLIDKMYPNPFDRKHSTIRQLIDKIIFPDSNSKRKNLKNVINNSSNNNSNTNYSINSWRKKHITNVVIIQTK